MEEIEKMLIWQEFAKEAKSLLNFIKLVNDYKVLDIKQFEGGNGFVEMEYIKANLRTNEAIHRIVEKMIDWLKDIEYISRKNIKNHKRNIDSIYGYKPLPIDLRMGVNELRYY